MAIPYDPRNWYWRVAGDNTKVYSSAASDYVLVADAAYVAWLSGGGVPSNIASEAELGEVLAKYFLRPVPAMVLDAFKEAQANTYTPVDVTPKILHYMLNEIRALQSKPSLTFEQFRQAVKDRM